MTLTTPHSNEQGRSNAALRQSVKWLRTLLAHSYDALVLMSANGTVLFASPSIQRILGYTPEEYMALNLADLTHPAQLEEGIAEFQRILEQSGVSLIPRQTRFRHRDGSWRWIEYTATNLLNDPDIAAIVFNFRDISESKQIEENQYLLAAIVSSSDDAIVSKTLEGIITSWNGAAERLFGYTASEAVGQSILLIIPPELQHEEATILSKLRRGERIEHYETARCRKDGTKVNVSLSISPVRDRQGKIIGGAKIARDITERKKQDLENARLYRQAKEAREQLEIILQGVADGIVVYNHNNQIVYLNEAAAHLTGFSTVQAMMEVPSEAIIAQFELIDEHGESFLPSQLPHRRVLAGELEAQAVIGYRSAATGYTEHWSLITTRPVLDEHEQVILAISILHDISERLRAEQRKDEFISMASHELKTPVTSMKGFATVLQRRLNKQGDEQGLAYLAKIERQINRLTGLISELLDISRIQTGKLAFQEEVFDLASLARETVENVQQTTQTHRLLLQSTRPVQMMGDRERIGQVLMNLLTNAIKYSPQADRVIISVTGQGDWACLSVQDFGIGIAPEHQQHIFERFYQVTGPNGHTFPGLGIGLYLSNEIVARHGGHIEVESDHGRGSTFTVSLPLLNAIKEI